MLEKPDAPCLLAFIGVWIRQFVATARNLLLNPPWGRLDGLLRERRTSAQDLTVVANAAWRAAGPCTVV